MTPVWATVRSDLAGKSLVEIQSEFGLPIHNLSSMTDDDYPDVRVVFLGEKGQNCEYSVHFSPSDTSSTKALRIRELLFTITPGQDEAKVRLFLKRYSPGMSKEDIDKAIKKYTKESKIANQENALDSASASPSDL